MLLFFGQESMLRSIFADRFANVFKLIWQPLSPFEM
jgi:hypothetical protein